MAILELLPSELAMDLSHETERASQVASWQSLRSLEPFRHAPMPGLDDSDEKLQPGDPWKFPSRMFLLYPCVKAHTSNPGWPSSREESPAHERGRAEGVAHKPKERPFQKEPVESLVGDCFFDLADQGPGQSEGDPTQ